MSVKTKSDLDVVRKCMKKGMTMTEIKNTLGSDYTLEDIAVLQLKLMHDVVKKPTRKVSKKATSPIGKTYTVYDLIKERNLDSGMSTIVEIVDSDKSYIYRDFRDALDEMNIQPNAEKKELVCKVNGVNRYRASYTYTLTPEQKITLFGLVDRRSEYRELAKKYNDPRYLRDLISGKVEETLVSRGILADLLYRLRDGRHTTTNLNRISHVLNKLNCQYTLMNGIIFYSLTRDKFTLLVKVLDEEYNKEDLIFDVDKYMKSLQTYAELDTISTQNSIAELADLKEEVETKKSTSISSVLIQIINMLICVTIGAVVGLFLATHL
jgi:hypothetical protein